MRLICVGSGSKGNCYLLEYGGCYLALDAGCKFQDVQVACNFETAKIVGCLVTHAHSDHAKYLPVFLQYGIDCYTGAGATTNIAKATGATLNALKANKWNKIGAFEILAFDVPHEDEPTYGFVIKASDGQTLMYLTDFQYNKYTFRRLHLNNMLIACNHMDDVSAFEGENHFAHIVQGHSSLAVVKACISANMTKDLSHVILCHLSSRNADADEMKRQVQETVGNKVTVDIADKGVSVEL